MQIWIYFTIPTCLDGYHRLTNDHNHKVLTCSKTDVKSYFFILNYFFFGFPKCLPKREGGGCGQNKNCVTCAKSIILFGNWSPYRNMLCCYRDCGSYLTVCLCINQFIFSFILFFLADTDFHLTLGFKFPTQTLVFTSYLVSRKGSLHRHWF